MTLFIILWILSGILCAYIVRKKEGPIAVPFYLILVIGGPIPLGGMLIELLMDWKI